MILGYTTIKDVIDEAGLDGDLLDIHQVTRTKIQAAESIVNGTIGNIYSLPLGYRWRNYVEFTGRGTGSATLTITINSVSYTVSVTDEMLPSKAADLFRQAIIDAGTTTLLADPVSDFPGNERVYFVSQSLVSATALTQVDVTNTPGAAGGITATEAAMKEKGYPGMIESMTRMIAAALLLRESYGKNSQGSDNDGQAKFEQAMEFLDKINSGEIKIMDDIAGTEIGKSSSVLPRYTVDDTSTEGLESGETGFTPRNFIYDEQF
jgi:hypothetical protein